MITNRIGQFTNVTTAPVGETGVPIRLHRPIRARLVRNALQCAIRGLQDAWRSQPNVRLHGYFGLGVMLLGTVCRLSLSGWLWVVFAIGLVLFAELMNTAIEQTVDLVIGLRPDPLARQIKDVAAGCVLIATILSVIIETLVFVPQLIN